MLCQEGVTAWVTGCGGVTDWELPREPLVVSMRLGSGHKFCGSHLSPFIDWGQIVYPQIWASS